MKRTEYKNLQTELGWNSLKSRRYVAKGCLTFKIMNGLTPNFLKQNFQESHPSERLLRNKTRLLQKKCRLTSYSKSFFPNQTSFWNKLSTNLINKMTLVSFKRDLIVETGDLHEDSSDHLAFLSCNGYYGKILTQLRLGLSPLRSHLFKYQISDNPFCPSCYSEIESVSHLFLHCMAYDAARKVLFDNIANIDVTWLIINNNDKVELLLRGHKLTSNKTETNVKIFNLAQVYLQTIRRFTNEFAP